MSFDFKILYSYQIQLVLVKKLQVFTDVVKLKI
jgi:hypothetical protein